MAEAKKKVDWEPPEFPPNKQCRSRVINGVRIPMCNNYYGVIKFSCGYQLHELFESVMGQWRLSNRSEAIRRLLLPLCSPIKRAILDKKDNAVIQIEIPLNPEHYEDPRTII